MTGSFRMDIQHFRVVWLIGSTARALHAVDRYGPLSYAAYRVDAV